MPQCGHCHNSYAWDKWGASGGYCSYACRNAASNAREAQHQQVEAAKEQAAAANRQAAAAERQAQQLAAMAKAAEQARERERAEREEQERRAAIAANDARDLEEARLRECPACAERIKAEAKKCRYCHTDLPDAEEARLASLERVVQVEKNHLRRHLAERLDAIDLPADDAQDRAALIASIAERLEADEERLAELGLLAPIEERVDRYLQDAESEAHELIARLQLPTDYFCADFDGDCRLESPAVVGRDIVACHSAAKVTYEVIEISLDAVPFDYGDANETFVGLASWRGRPPADEPELGQHDEPILLLPPGAARDNLVRRRVDQIHTARAWGKLYDKRAFLPAGVWRLLRHDREVTIGPGVHVKFSMSAGDTVSVNPLGAVTLQKLWLDHVILLLSFVPGDHVEFIGPHGAETLRKNSEARRVRNLANCDLHGAGVEAWKNLCRAELARVPPATHRARAMARRHFEMLRNSLPQQQLAEEAAAEERRQAEVAQAAHVVRQQQQRRAVRVAVGVVVGISLTVGMGLLFSGLYDRCEDSAQTASRQKLPGAVSADTGPAITPLVTAKAPTHAPSAKADGAGSSETHAKGNSSNVEQSKSSDDDEPANAPEAKTEAAPQEPNATSATTQKGLLLLQKAQRLAASANYRGALANAQAALTERLPPDRVPMAWALIGVAACHEGNAPLARQAHAKVVPSLRGNLAQLCRKRNVSLDEDPVEAKTKDDSDRDADNDTEEDDNKDKRKIKTKGKTQKANDDDLDSGESVVDEDD